MNLFLCRTNQSGAFPPDGMADFSQQERWIDGDDLASGKAQTCLASRIFVETATPAVLDRPKTRSGDRNAKTCAPALNGISLP